MKIFIAALFLFCTPILAQQNYIILKKNVDYNPVYAVVSNEGKELKTIEGITDVQTYNRRTSFVDIKARKSGFLDPQGNVLVPPTYHGSEAGIFWNGFAIVFYESESIMQSAAIDSTGKVVIPFSSTYLMPYSEGWFAYWNQMTDERGYLNFKNEKMPLPKGDEGFSFQEGKATVTDSEGKGYFIDKKGAVWQNKRYDVVSSFCGGYAAVRESYPAPFILIDKNGKTVFTFDKAIETNVTSLGNGWVHIDSPNENGEGHVVVNVLNKTPETNYAISSSHPAFSEGLLATQKGFIDIKGNLVIDMKGEKYVEKQPFNNGYAVITKPDPKNAAAKIYYLIDKKGKTVWKSESIGE